MENVNKIEAVTERDIDLLLLEELNVSSDFAGWLYATVTQSKEEPTCIGAWHSISDAALGESDLVAIYENRVALLLENKVSALAQPDQGKRYKFRGEKGISAGLWERFFTCMVAPDLYLQREKDSSSYDVNLSYEGIASWFSSSGVSDRRATYKSYLINEAIEQNRRGYTMNPDARVTEFWSKYWQLSIQQYPDLEMKQPGIKPANSDWPNFRPSAFGQRFSIVHKLERGHVDLQIPGAADKLEVLQTLVSDLEVDIAKAGKSAAIRIKVDPLDRFASFDSQKNVAIDGMDAARRLLEIGRNLIEQKLPRGGIGISVP